MIKKVSGKMNTIRMRNRNVCQEQMSINNTPIPESK